MIKISNISAFFGKTHNNSKATFFCPCRFDLRKYQKNLMLGHLSQDWNDGSQTCSSGEGKYI
jgi:hypothetical protein